MNLSGADWNPPFNCLHPPLSFYQARRKERGRESGYLITHPDPGTGHAPESALPQQFKEGGSPVFHINGKITALPSPHTPPAYLPQHAAVNNSHFISMSVRPRGASLLPMKRYRGGLEGWELGQDKPKQLLRSIGLDGKLMSFRRVGLLSAPVHICCGSQRRAKAPGGHSSSRAGREAEKTPPAAEMVVLSHCPRSWTRAGSLWWPSQPSARLEQGSWGHQSPSEHQWLAQGAAPPCTTLVAIITALNL